MSLGERRHAVHRRVLEAAEVEDEASFAGDLARTVLRRIGRQLPDREGRVLARLFETFPFVVEPLDERDGRRDRIAPRSPRLGAGMRVGAEGARPTKKQTTAK